MLAVALDEIYRVIVTGEGRLRGREIEVQEAWTRYRTQMAEHAKRVSDLRLELAAEPEFDAVVVNDRVESAARELSLRKPSARTGALRIVEVSEFDVSACGGTHVPRSGMVGIIAITGWERFKGGVRVSFVCGGRALGSHRTLRDILLGTTRALSVLPAELPARVDKLQAELKEARAAQRALAQEVVLYRAADWRAHAEPLGVARVVLLTDAAADAEALRADERRERARQVRLDPPMLVAGRAHRDDAAIDEFAEADIGPVEELLARDGSVVGLGTW